MMDKISLFKLENLVLFKLNNVEIIGTIYNARFNKDFEAYQYDIFVENEDTIYKNISEDQIIGRIKM